MDDKVISDITGASPTPPSAPPVAGAGTSPVSFVGSDGKFTENWRSALPEEIRNEKYFDSFKDLPGLAKTAYHASKLVGADKIVRPTDKSTPEEWDAYYTAGGRPKDAAGYQLEPPPEIKDYIIPERMTQARDVLHKAGLNQKQVNDIFGLYSNWLKDDVKNMGDNQVLAKKTAEDSLRTKWGTQYDERLHMANRIISENVASDEEKEELLASVGNSPAVANFLSNIADKFMEAKLIVPEVTATNNIDSQIAEEMAKPEYLGGFQNGKQISPQLHQAAIDKVNRLMEQKRRISPTR